MSVATEARGFGPATHLLKEYGDDAACGAVAFNNDYLMLRPSIRVTCKRCKRTMQWLRQSTEAKTMSDDVKPDADVRPDSIAHGEKRRASFQERYEAARWRRQVEQEASGLEVSISVRDNYREHPKWALDRVEKGLGP